MPYAWAKLNKYVRLEVLTVYVECEVAFSSTFQKHLLPPSPNVGTLLPEYTASSYKTVVFEYSNYLHMRTKPI
jgi:hypothetical protein